jgi:uncharacterized protein YybS (DUF2232 family)
VPKKTKKEIKIYFQDQQRHKQHPINQAIFLINSIIRLIFKNNRDQSALMLSNQHSSSLGPLSNHALETKRMNEIQKLSKSMNIKIPSKFENKTAIREFFQSKEFIFQIKSKMNTLLHTSINEGNRMLEQMEKIQQIKANQPTQY